jgi:Allophanate hydrolase subunit 2
MANFVRVIQPGLSTTVQDLGRPNHQIEGFPESGAMDRFSYKLANYWSIIIAIRHPWSLFQLVRLYDLLAIPLLL